MFTHRPADGSPTHPHDDADDARACEFRHLGPCPDLIERWYLDADGMPDSMVVACGHRMYEVGPAGREARCTAGHSHVSAQFRADEGWEYAEDGDEAAALARAGVEPVML